MTDDELIALLEVKDRNALIELENKYGAYCKSIAMNILRSRQDCDECLNDVYLSVWNAIPPARPDDLRMYLAGIVRNTSISHWRKLHAQKRGSGHVELLLEELSDAAAADTTLLFPLPDELSPEDACDPPLPKFAAIAMIAIAAAAAMHMARILFPYLCQRR